MDKQRTIFLQDATTTGTFFKSVPLSPDEAAARGYAGLDVDLGDPALGFSTYARSGNYHLDVAIFHDETKACEWLEARVWKNGRVCPKCGVVDQSTLMTDESPIYFKLGKEYSAHHTVNHSAGEDARLGGYIHIATAESFFSIFTLGVTGSFHHVSEAHLHRYLCEFDFR